MLALELIYLEEINRVSVCNINIILFGNKNLKLAENIIIFQAVHEFMKNSKRFALDDDAQSSQLTENLAKNGFHIDVIMLNIFISCYFYTV